MRVLTLDEMNLVGGGRHGGGGGGGGGSHHSSPSHHTPTHTSHTVVHGSVHAINASYQNHHARPQHSAGGKTNKDGTIDTAPTAFGNMCRSAASTAGGAAGGAIGSRVKSPKMGAAIGSAIGSAIGGGICPY